MRIRRATPEDAEAIAAIERAAATGPWSADAVRDSLALPTTLGLLAEAGIPAGHLLASAAAGEGEVLILAVHPDHQRRGVARRLLDRCEEIWAEQGVERAFLEVRADNVPALGLYASAGWTRVGERRGYYRDGTHAVALRWERP